MLMLKDDKTLKYLQNENNDRTSYSLELECVDNSPEKLATVRSFSFDITPPFVFARKYVERSKLSVISTKMLIILFAPGLC